MEASKKQTEKYPFKVQHTGKCSKIMEVLQIKWNVNITQTAHLQEKVETCVNASLSMSQNGGSLEFISDLKNYYKKKNYGILTAEYQEMGIFL